MIMTEMVFDTLVQYGHVTRLRAREDYIKFSRRESSKTYSCKLFIYWKFDVFALYINNKASPLSYHKVMYSSVRRFAYLQPLPKTLTLHSSALSKTALPSSRR